MLYADDVYIGCTTKSPGIQGAPSLMPHPKALYIG